MDATTISIWPLVLTSAGVAALVSAGATVIGQLLERRARRKELLLTKAIELAVRHTETSLEIAKRSGMTLRVQDDLVSAATYYKWLQSLWDTGELPDDPRIQQLGPSSK
jgi:hypothetical protein